MSSSGAKSLSHELLSPVWTHLTHIRPTRAAGIYLYATNTNDDSDDDDDNNNKGKRYMDFTSGIGVTNTGHCHPKIVQAIQRQAQQLIFGQVNIVIPPSTVELSHQLSQLMRQAHWPSLNRFYFANSGSEAVEASVKLARHATGKTNLICFQGSFHGRSHQTMAMTSAKTIYRVNYQPLPGGIFFAPYPNPHYFSSGAPAAGDHWDVESTIDFCLQELHTLLQGQSRPDETAAVIIEPVLGEGGYVPAPPRFLRELRKLCTEHDILFIADEVQSGMGRTGKMFSLEHAAMTQGKDDASLSTSSSSTAQEVVEPDILVLAKGLGSGVPISAIASRQDLMDRWIPGSHGGTYGGGSALATAAAVATIKVLQSEGLLDNATARGHQLQAGLKQLQQDLAANQNSSSSSMMMMIRSTRGLGLMVGTEFQSKEMAKAVQQACLQRNLLLLTCGTRENVIRWIPPLVVTSEQIDEALNIFTQAVLQQQEKEQHT